jgi:acetyl esterase/lipase
MPTNDLDPGVAALDPEIAAVLSNVPPDAFDFGSWTIDSIPSERAARAAIPVPPPPPTTTVHRDIVVPGPLGSTVPLRVYAPPAPAPHRPCIYWIHGGGYFMGSPLTVDVRLNRWVQRLGCTVVAVDYRLAPEHPYPAALDDCDAGLSWTAAHVDELGIDPARIVLAGGSAGGGLAAALALVARDRGGPALCGLVLVYPMLDDRHVTPSSRQPHAFVWSREANLLGWRAYLGREPGSPDVPAYAAPGRLDDVAGLAPTFIGVGALDLFRDEDIAFASRLLAAGVPTELHVYPGAPHGFDVVAPAAAVSRRFDADLSNALERAMTRAPESSDCAREGK